MTDELINNPDASGDTNVRASLYSAANSLLSRTKHMSPLKAWGLRLVKRRGRKRRTVAVARKFAGILHRMWIDGIGSLDLINF